MAQARRKKARVSKKQEKNGAGIASQAFMFLFAGILIGVLSTLFWQGYRTSHDDDIGSGLKDMVDKSRENSQKQQAQQDDTTPIVVADEPRQKAQYDFYTVLPAIEEVLPKEAEEPAPASAPEEQAPIAAADKPTETAPNVDTAYFLQVASYQREADAEGLKAKLALSGLRATIQSVSIEQKQYYRVRIGPYTDYGNMTAADYKLSQMGFKALRLRVKQG